MGRPRLGQRLRRSAAAAALVLTAVAASRGEPPVKTVTVSRELNVSIDAGEQVILAARPLPGESVDAFVKRFTDDPKTEKAILEQNEGVKLLKPNVFVRVPYRLLSNNYRKIAMEALFPQDRADARGWDHLVTAPAGHPESLWRIAEWFTGDGANDREIRSERQIASLDN